MKRKGDGGGGGSKDVQKPRALIWVAAAWAVLQRQNRTDGKGYKILNGDISAFSVLFQSVNFYLIIFFIPSVPFFLWRTAHAAETQIDALGFICLCYHPLPSHSPPCQLYILLTLTGNMVSNHIPPSSLLPPPSSPKSKCVFWNERKVYLTEAVPKSK